jgi:cytochrome c oxidase subunit II
MAKMARTIAAALLATAWAGMATAQAQAPLYEHEGPFPWQMNLQPPATRIMEFIDWFNWYTIIIVGLICLLVTGLLAWCIIRFNRSANPVPSRVTHHTSLEVAWTVIPILILVAIAVPSFRLLYAQYDPARIYEEYDPGTTPWLTVKLTGYQWYWGVEYFDDEDSQQHGVPQEFFYDALMLRDDELGENDLRLLSVDNPMVVPVNAFVRVLVTAGDVIHAFAMPAFGVKVDAVPGRLNETYFRAEMEGIFYGQCSELCGKDHAFMPIAIRVVSPELFQEWAAAAAENVGRANELLAERIAEQNEARRLAGR